MSLVKLVLMGCAAVTVSQVAQTLVLRPSAFAQSFGNNPETFPIPRSLPAGTTLKVDGSTSMQLTNEALEARFEAQYPDIDVQVAASRTDRAIEALLDGAIDLVASGRPLTEAEKAQGLTTVALEREKLAILLGPDNPFSGQLSFEQFAQIFRGEITNWSEVGGPNVPIRVVDRPDYSDTRRALSTYTVFEGKPFETGATADPAAADETDAVIAQLGTDGIGYAVVSQVLGREGVRILPMHETLPDDPRYPYSQYRSFIYREDAGPATLAFLGFATTAPGQEVIVDAADTGAVGSPGAADSDTADRNGAATSGTTDAIAGDAATSPTDTPPSADAASEATGDTDTALVPDAQADTEVEGAGFPWWWLLLLGLPLLGGLWWWRQGSGSDALADGAGAPPADTPPAAPPVPPADGAGPASGDPATVEGAGNNGPAPGLSGPVVAGGAALAAGAAAMGVSKLTEGSDSDATPDPAHGAIADDLPAADTPEVPAVLPGVPPGPVEATAGPDLKASDVGAGTASMDTRDAPATGAAAAIPPVAPDAPVAGAGAGVSIPGVALGGAALAAGAAAMGAAGLKEGSDSPEVAPALVPGDLTLTPQSTQKALAQWEIPAALQTQAKQAGGEAYQLRLYDVTGIDLDTQPPHRVDPYPVDEAANRYEVPIPQVDRDYLVEIGYDAPGDRWLRLARSLHVNIPAGYGTPDVPGGLGAAAIAGGLGVAAVAAAAAGPDEATPAADPLTPAAVAEDLAAADSQITLSPGTGTTVTANWQVPAVAKQTAQQQGGAQYQLRVYDVTAIDLDTQAAHWVGVYPCDETETTRTVSIPQAGRDYLAEIGYLTAEDRWLKLARSTHGYVPAIAGAAMLAGGAATAATGATSVPSSSQCAIQTIKVHSRHHAYQLEPAHISHLQDAVAARYTFAPGLHILRIRDGVFRYDGDVSRPGEPVVLLWIYGGPVINQKTDVPVNATWSTLNGYADTLTLDVKEPATLCAFFFDTHPADNTGEITLSIVHLP